MSIVPPEEAPTATRKAGRVAYGLLILAMCIGIAWFALRAVERFM